MIKKLFTKKDPMEWLYPQVISKAKTDEADIAVERISGPILFLSSALDAIWTSLYHCETAIKRLREKSFPYPYKHFTYEKSGHMLTLLYQSIPSQKKCNGYLQEWEEACLDIWKQTTDFLGNWGMDNSSN